jgi:hypothetical protein
MSVDANDLREALFVFCLVSSSLESPPQAAVQPSPESIQSRSGRIRPKPNLAGPRNPFGRRAHPGSRIHLTSRQPTRRNRRPKILAQRSGELRSHRMKTAVKSPESAVYRRGLGIFLTETPPTDTPTCPPKPRRRRKHFFRPLFPRNPHFPASGPAWAGAAQRRLPHWLFQGPPAESRFLSTQTTQCVSTHCMPGIFCLLVAREKPPWLGSGAGEKGVDTWGKA